MATFEAQVEGLTGINIEASGTFPTQAQLTQYLRDGVTDVINRTISLNPYEISKFTTTTNTDSGGVAKKGRILSVVREHDSTTILRPCSQIPPELRYEATDSSSLYYRSKFNPGFYELDGIIHIVPEAAAGNNDLVVTQVNYDTSIAYSDDEDNIVNFPQEYGYLVKLYAACKSLTLAMANMSTSLPDDIAIPPTPELPTIDDISVTITGTAPAYTKGAIAPDFADAENWLNVEEDSELVASRISIIQTQIGEYTAAIQDELNEFNKENVEYNTKMQKDLKDADLSDSKNAQKLALYEREVTAYQSKVAIEVQDYLNRVNKVRADYDWMKDRFAVLRSEYDNAFGLMAPKQEKQGEK